MKRVGMLIGLGIVGILAFGAIAACADGEDSGNGSIGKVGSLINVDGVPCVVVKYNENGVAISCDWAHADYDMP